MKKRLNQLLMVFAIALLFCPLYVKALNTYNESISIANRYLENFKKYDYDRYINTNIANMVYTINGYEALGFKRACFITSYEYSLSIANGQSRSYLATGIEYWTASKVDSNKMYTISTGLKSKEITGETSSRVAVYAKSSSYVSGNGSYLTPWEFLKSYTLFVGTNDSSKGTVSPNKIQYVIDGVRAEVTYTPKGGYKYYNNTCEATGATVSKSEDKLYISNLKSDTTCNIEFGPRTYKITLNGNPSPNVIYLKYNSGYYKDPDTIETINKLTSIPTKTGYKFVSYSKDDKVLVSSNGTINTSLKALYNSSVETQELDPIFEPIKYYIKFDSNTGSTSSYVGWYTDDVYQATYDVDVILKPNGYTKNGYTFAGWNTKADGSGNSYADEATIKNLTTVENDEVVLYAQWTPITYNVIYNHCKTSATKKVTYNFDQLFTIDSSFTHTGYYLQGYSSISCSGAMNYLLEQKYSNLSNVIGANVDLYAIWGQNKFYIKYNANGGSGAMSDTQCFYDNDCMPKANAFTRDGYVFVGWSKNSSATTPDASFKNLTTVKDGSVTIYAIWNACNAGTYTTDTISCKTCPAGSYCPNKGTSTPILCDAGTYSGSGAKSCTKCPAGSYCPKEGTTAPKTCIAGTYSEEGATKCTKCSAGKYSGEGASSCNPCNCGTYSGEGASSCTACSAGTSSSSGASSCTACAAGTSSSNGACSCSCCSAGTSSSSGASSCTACAAGTYNTSSCGSSCTKCPANYYCTGGTNRTACPSGTFSTAGSTKSSDCVPCTAGTYYSGGKCVSCPAGSYCQNGVATQCAAGTYSTGGASSCTKCPTGKYNTGTGNTSCSTCTVGKYNTGTGNTSCTTCTEGYYCQNGIRNICPAGTYSTSKGSTSCTTCEANYYCTGGTNRTACDGSKTSPAGSTKSSDCTLCGDGKYYSGGSCITCTAGYSCEGGVRKICAAGYYSNAGATTCTKCPAGKYNTGTGNTSCTTCESGYYCTGGNNHTSCNGYSPAGSTSASQCTNICSISDAELFGISRGLYAVGQSSANYGAVYNTTDAWGDWCHLGDGRICLAPQAWDRLCVGSKCGAYAGKTSKQINSEAGCSFANYWCTTCCTSGTNNGKCNECNAGNYKTSSGACIECAAGTYTTTAGQSECKKCEAGTYNTGIGNTSCTSCIGGYYASGTGNTSCTKCTAGHYASGSGNTYCRTCESGTYNTYDGATTCYSCIAGSYCTGGKKKACPAGTYSTSGASGCTKCPAGEYASGTGNTSCTKCDPGTYSNAGASSCTSCPVGTSNALSGQSACTKCNIGYYASSTGQRSCTKCPTGYTTAAVASTSSSDCVDRTKPFISCTVSNSGTTDGLTVNCTCSDNGSGCKASSTTNTRIKADTTLTLMDNAGNSASFTVSVEPKDQYRTRTCSNYKSCQNSSCGYVYSNYSYYYTTKPTTGVYNCSSTTVTSADCGTQNKTCTRYYCANTRTAKSCSSAGCATYKYSNYKYTYGSKPSPAYDCTSSSYTGSACGVKTYKTCQHKDCGTTTTTNTCRTSACGVESTTYKSCRTSACGVESTTYKSCANKACGAKTCRIKNTKTYLTAKLCTNNCSGTCSSKTCTWYTTETNGSVCGYNSCRTSACGVESTTYKACRTSACGVQSTTYKSCQHKDCGTTTTNKTCATSACGVSAYNTCTQYYCATTQTCSTYKTDGSVCGYSYSDYAYGYGSKPYTLFNYNCSEATGAYSGCGTENKSCTRYYCATTKANGTCEAATCGCATVLPGWSDWSSWSTTTCPTSSITSCDTRTVYNLSSSKYN